MSYTTLTLIFVFTAAINCGVFGQTNFYTGVAGGPQGGGPLEEIGQVVIKTKLGDLRGLEVAVHPMFTHPELMNAEPPKTAHAFLNVNYSDPVPRFSKGSPVKAWKGEKNATKWGPSCIPYLKFTEYLNVSYSEDCTFVDIYTPGDVNSTSNLPVLFYIHGGGYEIASSQFYPKQPFINLVVSQRIILVMIEYRMGFLGFLSNGQPDFAGNLGFWDQAMGLKFVVDNIAEFGGNPKDITITGNSAGGSSSSAMAISKHTRDLFQKVILSSGSMLNGWALNRDWNVEQTKIIADRIGCGGQFNNTPVLLDCMRKVPIEDFRNAIFFTGYYRNDMYALRLTPRADGDFFEEDPLEMIKTAPIKPTMVGINEVEMLVYVMTDYQEILFQNVPAAKWHEFYEADLHDFVHEQLAKPKYYGSNATARALEKRIVKYFINNPRKVFKSETDNSYMKDAIDIASNVLFNYGAIYEARVKAEAGAPVYFYLGTYWDKEHTYKDLPVRGCEHALDQAYWLGWWLYPITNPFPPKELSPAELKFSDNLINTISNFIRTGNPSLPANALGNNSPPLNWPKVEGFGKPLKFVELDAEMVIHTDGLWEDVFNFFTCLRCDYPQFDIMRANGAPPLSTNKSASESCQLCKSLTGGGQPSKGGSKGRSGKNGTQTKP